MQTWYKIAEFYTPFSGFWDFCSSSYRVELRRLYKEKLSKSEQQKLPSLGLSTSREGAPGARCPAFAKPVLSVESSWVDQVHLHTVYDSAIQRSAVVQCSTV